MTVRRLVIPPGVHELEETVQEIRLLGYDGENDLAKLGLVLSSPPQSGTSRQVATTAVVHVAMKSLVAAFAEMKEKGLLLDPPAAGQGLGQSIVGEPPPGQKRPQEPS